MFKCKRISSGTYAEYHYRGFAITRFEFDDHWNVGEIDGAVFDARQTKAECKLMIDRIVDKIGE